LICDGALIGFGASPGVRVVRAHWGLFLLCHFT